ncbi:MAG TPA: chalcone isomerase family protein [Thermoanaerobaculia bacterium]|nr:chalcone isomerase family protein [Thermoanaerobaculia bacterium]
MRKFVITAALTLAAVSAGAATIAGVKFDDAATVGTQKLVLNGSALRKKFVVKVYAGALYLPSKQNNAAAIIAADAPRRQVMHFLYDVDMAKMAEAWEEGLEANTPNASAEVKTAFRTLGSWMEDMKEGQRIVLTYAPGTGTTVEVNGKNKGTLGGKAVADAILNTWIGPKPGPGADFKKGVLGQ